MKVLYNVAPTRGEYTADKKFTYGKEYNVLADYRQRNSKQVNRDNGFVIIDDTGESNMLLSNEILITDTDIKNVYVFSNKYWFYSIKQQQKELINFKQRMDHIMSKYFKKGDFVKVAEENDNNCYDDFRNKRLKIVSVATNTKQHQGYDESVQGMPLYDLEDENGNYINCSLYAYELELS